MLCLLTSQMTTLTCVSPDPRVAQVGISCVQVPETPTSIDCDSDILRIAQMHRGRHRSSRPTFRSCYGPFVPLDSNRNCLKLAAADQLVRPDGQAKGESEGGT